MSRRGSQSAWLVSTGFLLLLLAILLWRGRANRETAAARSTLTNGTPSPALGPDATSGNGIRRPAKAGTAATTPEAVVAEKLARFARSRRDIAHAMAKLKNIAVHPSVERFFDAVESGDWTAIKAAFDEINGGEANAGHTSKRLPEVLALWAPIIDAYGAAEQVHLWPAQKLLDYGNAILDQLKPGMVYVGGTDEGRWIPTLLNETSDGERHIVLTQNGLADGTYLEYLRFLYSDQLTTLSSDDSQRAFQSYIADAQKRAEHDRDFPDEPKQVRPGEVINIDNNRVAVSGQVAVMDINERLLRTLMENNPGLSFALQESFPLKGTYGDAAPLGPITQLRAGEEAAFTSERAAESVNYWRQVAGELSASPDAEKGDTPLKAYSKLAVGQANLFADRGFTAEAEQTYRIALGMRGSNTDAALGLAGLLERSGRQQEAQAFLEQFSREHPSSVEALNRFRRSGSVTISGKP